MKWARLAEMVLGPHGHVASTSVGEMGGTGELCTACVDFFAFARARCAKHAFQLSLRHSNGCSCLVV